MDHHNSSNAARGGEGGNQISTADKPTILEDAMHNLFEGLTDKEDALCSVIQHSIVKILETHPLRATDILIDYKKKQTNMTDNMVSIYIKVIERLVCSNAIIPIETKSKIVSFTIDELTKSTDNVPIVQNHALGVLVAIGSGDGCNIVIDALLKYTNEGMVTHFMIMQSIGAIATANIIGIVPYIKRILVAILPSLASIKLDHIRQSHAYAIGRLSEALLEYSSTKQQTLNSTQSNENQNENQNDLKLSAEISIAYDMLFNNWLTSREPKVCVEILQALSSMYPLLPIEKINDQSSRLIPHILSLYRRSIERNSVTQFLSSVLKTNIALQSNTLDSIADQLISNLFDLVCVYPDYEKPQTVKGHYEVLRCFHLLSNIYATKIMETLLMHLRNNSERERIKSLLILTHLLNTSTVSIEKKLNAFLECLKQMIFAEKSIKMKMTLLTTIVALAQKSFIKEKEFIWFIVRYSCKYTKINQEYGTIDEHTNFVVSCENSLFMLSSTVGTIDELLKLELLNYFVLLDYTDICSNLAKCLTSLFAKSPNIEFDVSYENETDDNKKDGTDEPLNAKANSNIKGGKLIVPTANTIFARCLALLGNHQCIKRSSNILSFLKYYYPHLNPGLADLWEKRIADLMLALTKKSLFDTKFVDFIVETAEFLNAQNENLCINLVDKMAEQLIMYPINIPHNEFFIPTLNAERGLLLKAIALTLCYVKDVQIINSKIDLIINSAKQEKLDKHVKHTDYEMKIEPCALALGYISRVHLQHLIKRLAELAHIGGRKHSTGFFSNLHFIKDTHKEMETYKINLLIIKAFGHIMDEADPLQSLQNLDDTILNFLIQQLTDNKDQVIMSAILKTLLSICNQMIATKEELTAPLKYRKQIMEAVFSIPIQAPFDDLPLLPTILKLGTDFICIGGDDTTESVNGSVIFEIACKNFFTCAENLKSKFDSQEEDERNSYLAQHLNESLPELNALVRIIIEMDPEPSTLDLIISILETWTRDKNSEVRICASHVYNNALDIYIKSMKIGCEAPSKFNQTGQMLGKIVPRCIDSNGTVRQVSVEILQKTLEISCIYETLTIAGSETDWMKELEIIKENIITDDSIKMYNLAHDIARVIAFRICSFQHLQFCKTLLQCLDDPEENSSIGASIVLKFFIKEKGSELFHAIPDLVKDSLASIQGCEVTRAKSGVLKALVALTKHHPKLVCSEMLVQPLPYNLNIIEYWHLVCSDTVVTGIILDYFLQILASSCLYEPNEKPKNATAQSFAIFCALREMLPCNDIKEELELKFPQIFTTLITSLASYINLAPPTNITQSSTPTTSSVKSKKHRSSPTTVNATIENALTNISISPKLKLNSFSNKNSVKLNPCEVVLNAFQALLNNLGYEQISTVLNENTKLSVSTDFKNFIELLSPMAISLSNQLQIGSTTMKEVITALSKYVSCPYDGHRIAAVGLFSRIVPLKPCGEISGIVMMHLSSALSDPNAVVRGLAIQGMGYVGHLAERDTEKYTEIALNALLKGIDDVVSDSVINIPLESMRGLSRILKALPSDRVESFHISLAIRMRPFFGNYSTEIREAAIILFGDLCESKITENYGELSPNSSSEALREQLFANLFPLLLHLGETDIAIIRACKGTLRKVCGLLNSLKVNDLTQRHLIDHGQLNYDVFIIDFVKVIAMELADHIQDFINSCIPKLRSQWPEVRGSAAIVIGILHNFLPERNTHTESVGLKLATLLKDENVAVRCKAAVALGYFFGDI